MRELEVINRYLGGHAITVRGVEELVRQRSMDQEVHIAEIGCGGGDNLQAIRRWAERKGIKVQLTGVDINPECIAFARQKPVNKGIHFICADYKEADFTPQPHLLFSSLFCHHFTDGELGVMLKWMHRNSRWGFFINDLHRHPLAYYSIKLLTRLFSKSYLVKNDAPLSVKRGFCKEDWADYFAGAGISSYQCRWQWAFRWLVSCKK
ncbi:methyltransferase domain-containing protein [Paraflavisolibacter sp. H34]|uniref:methyltransferase domain-containing protein n=1 Tax=Huijunlia imazamoxiresistens TaxID=3127457 RepID=UPI0030189F5E